MALRLIGYCRVSTDEQAMYGHGLDAQEAKIREYCRRINADLAIEKDEGISGKSLERPALMRSLNRIASRDVDGIVVAKLDRLTRSVIDFAMLLEWFTAAGAQLVALDFDLDTGTASGKLVAHIMASVAEWERGIISQRTREALAIRRAQGLPTGRAAVHSDVAGRIQRLREEGHTLQGICDQLNAEGVPTTRGAEVWRPSAIQAALGYKRKTRPKKIAALPEIRRR